jgi:hypothetical protein
MRDRLFVFHGSNGKRDITAETRRASCVPSRCIPLLWKRHPQSRKNPRMLETEPGATQPALPSDNPGFLIPTLSHRGYAGLFKQSR